jgi:hypothetical protein
MTMVEPVTAVSAYKSFIVKHDQFLTVLGGLILFLTFIVKDNKREEYKELTSSISHAGTVFSVRNQILDITTKLNFISNSVDLLSRLSKKLPVKESPEEVQDVLNAYSAADDFTGRATIELDMLTDLTTEISRLNPALKKAIAEKRKKADALQEALEKDGSLLNLKLDRTESDPDPDHEVSLAKLGARFISYTNVSIRLMSDTTDLRDRVMKELEELRKKSEKSLQTYSRWSVVLFVFGSSLTLIAKLMGSKSAIARE